MVKQLQTCVHTCLIVLEISSYRWQPRLKVLNEGDTSRRPTETFRRNLSSTAWKSVSTPRFRPSHIRHPFGESESRELPHGIHIKALPRASIMKKCANVQSHVQHEELLGNNRRANRSGETNTITPPQLPALLSIAVASTFPATLTMFWMPLVFKLYNSTPAPSLGT